jgi:histone acetyltransferase 1
MDCIFRVRELWPLLCMIQTLTPVHRYEIATPTTPTASAYSFVGYATTYRWWFYKPEGGEHTVQDGQFPYPEELRFSTLPSRLRIAQFLILPPHQNSGHGSHLYNAIHTAAVEDPTIVELTVEDPNENFDVLRDQSDYRILRPEFVKRQVNLNPNPYPANVGRKRPRRMPTAALIPTQTLAEIRSKYKIAPTQFAHILEMFLLSAIPEKHRNVGGANMARLLIKKHNADDENDRRYYWWRMLVKQRLYKRSRDILVQLDLSDRYAKLDETLVNVEEGYETLLKVFELGEERRALEALQGAEEPTSNGSLASPSSSRTKRKYAVVEDDEDEDDSGDEGSSKRSKV